MVGADRRYMAMLAASAHTAVIDAVTVETVGMSAPIATGKASHPIQRGSKRLLIATAAFQNEPY